jgi:hypothetical protein
MRMVFQGWGSARGKYLLLSSANTGPEPLCMSIHINPGAPPLSIPRIGNESDVCRAISLAGRIVNGR